MVESSTTHPTQDSDALWELIPWFVNGSLSDEEIALVEQRRETDPEFAAEIERQLAVATGVCMLSEPEIEAAEARSWAKLSAQIAADEAARTPTPAQQSWWSALLSNLQGGYAMAGVACAALMLAVFVMGGDGSTGDDGFRTLTSDPNQVGVFIKLQPAADVSAAEIEQILAANGLTLVDGPSEGGVYRAEAPGEADLEQVAEALMSAPEITFAAPE